MIDYIGLSVVGIALFIGFFPLFLKKNRSGDFLICHVDNRRDGMEEEKDENKKH